MCRGNVYIIVLFIVLLDQAADESLSYLPQWELLLKDLDVREV